MRSPRHANVLLFYLLALTPASAAQERPTIGLALSGGGARGAAHVGVLKVLEEQRVPVDYVAGTSMGAIVGGFYAAGYSPGEIGEILTTLDWADVLADRTAYRELAFRRKEDERRYMMDVDLGVGRKGFKLPPGLRTGQKLGFLLSRYLRGVADTTDFDQLPTPFRAVAADITTGEEVVLGSGQLATAIRASMAIPGVFSPVDLDGRLLVDGGIANNVPVDVVREMGADVVIAVDIAERLLTREELDDFLEITNQALNMLTRGNMESRLAKADLVLVPAVQEFGSMAFDDARGVIDAGEAEARRHLDALVAWSLDEDAWQRHAAARRPPEPREVEVAFVRVEGNVHVDERQIRHRIDTRPGTSLDLDILGEDLERVFGLDDFEQVRFDLAEDDGASGVVFTVKEKAWGPSYLRFGLNFRSDLLGDTGFTALLNVTSKQLNARGAEWRNELRIGEDQGVLSEIYQPFDFAGRYFLAPRLEVRTETQAVYDDAAKVAEYRITTAEAGLDLGVRLGHHGELRLGALRGGVEARVKTGSAVLPSFDVNRGGFRLRLAVDTTDNAAIPRRGTLLDVELFLSLDALGAELLPYELFSLHALKAMSRGRHTFLLGADGGSDLGSELPSFEEFRVGGLLSFGGYAEGQLRGPVFAVARLGYHYRFFDGFPGLGDVFGGAVVETGDVWPSGEDVQLDDLRTSVSVMLMTETFFGPLFLAYGVAEDGNDRFYLHLGRTF